MDIGIAIGMRFASTNAPSARLLPSNNLLGWIGDSRLNQGITIASPSAITLETIGLQFWGPALAEGRARVRPSDSLATSGDNSDDILEDVSAVVASGCGSCVILVSINDRSTQTAAWSLAKIDAAIAQLRAAGVVVLLCNEMPVTGFLTPPQAADHVAVHHGLNARHNPTHGVYVVDTWGALERERGADTPADGVYLDQMQLKHPDTKGAYLAGNALAVVLREILPLDPTVFPTDAADPRLLSTNPYMTGAGGVLTAGAGGSGKLADGFTYARASAAIGVTAVMSKENDPLLGAPSQKYVFGGSPTGVGSIDFARQQNLQTGLGADQYAEQVLDVVIGADLSNVRSVKAGVRMVGTEDNWHTTGDEGVGHSLPTFSAPIRLVIRSPRVRHPGALSNLVNRPGSYQLVGVPVSGSIWIRCCALLKYGAA